MHFITIERTFAKDYHSTLVFGFSWKGWCTVMFIQTSDNRTVDWWKYQDHTDHPVKEQLLHRLKVNQQTVIMIPVSMPQRTQNYNTDMKKVIAVDKVYHHQ
jgi:hypothetical protein